MEIFDLTKLTESELRELSAGINKEFLAREDTKKNELAKAIIQSIKAYTKEFGELKIEFDYEDNRVYFSDEDNYVFYLEEDMIMIS